MSSMKSVWAAATATALLLSCVLVFLSRNASADSVTWTSDLDFSTGNFFKGTGFETELHGSGSDAFVQNSRDMPNWFEKYPAINPGARSGFGFSNDSEEDRFVLFGGLDDASSARNDTWEYDIATGDWVPICDDNVCAPYRRSYPSMAYDNSSKVVVMYGGIAEDMSTLLTDTWEYDVTTNIWENWTLPTRPRGLTSHSMVYDAGSQSMVLVGRGAASMEVWTYAHPSHLWTNVTPHGGPARRSGFALGYSYQPGHQCAVLFGGAEVMTVYNDTWEYDSVTNSWTQADPAGHPDEGAGSSMTYSFKQHLMGVVLWGGSSWTGYTWRYFWDAGAPTWMQVPTTTFPNPPRKNHGLAYDPASDLIILYGGSGIDGSRLNDTWTLENGYRLEGRYASSFFNSYDSQTEWQYLLWNGTSDPGTVIRFQLDFSNSCEDADLPFWRGPNGATNTYYTSPGEAIWPYQSMCIRFLADLITMNPQVAPALQDVTIIYELGNPSIPPKVINVFPVGFDVSTFAPIYINFTKPMDTGNVFISVVPNYTFDTPWTWYQGDTKLKITHNSLPFPEGKMFSVCVWGTDKQGHLLNYTNSKYCWMFVTRMIAPYAVSTYPANGQTNVPLTANIMITFSAPMNESTCWPYVTIDPNVAFDDHAWSNGDTHLVMMHTPFQQITTYTVNLPMNDPARPCMSRSGALIVPGPVPVPWSFTTGAVNPIVLSTYPINLETRAPSNSTITTEFSRDMNVSSLSFALKNFNGVSWVNSTVTLSPSWTDLRNLTFSHATDFTVCRAYQMQVWALDSDGRSLISNPNVQNPWRFQIRSTNPNGCEPSMLSTSPYDGEENVSESKNITIAWHYDPDAPTGGMNPSKFSFMVMPEFGYPVTDEFVANWTGAGPDIVELRHPTFPLAPCMKYEVRVLTAEDKLGRPFIPGMAANPFKFRVGGTSCPPMILWTQPAHMQIDIFPDGMDIKVKFSKEMDIDKVSVSILPTLQFHPPEWTEGNTTLTLGHDPFHSMTIYNVSVSGSDLDGNQLVHGPAANPWTFYTTCDPCPPYITNTSPAHMQMDVPWDAPIWINFSEEMDPTSFNFALDPSAGILSQEWMNNDTTVKINHSVLFTECSLYTANVVHVQTKSGEPLVGGPAPNPWIFRARCIKPFIVSTAPADGARDVALDSEIVIVFSKPMDPSSILFSLTPTITFYANMPDAWTFVITPTTPFKACTMYTAQVLDARDISGNSLGPSPVPNPWTFSTDSCSGVRGLQVHRSPPGVFLTWLTDPIFDYYHVFHSTDRFARWPWTVIATVTVGYAAFPDHISDMSNHFYIVRGHAQAGESSNSTMGALWHMGVTPNPGGGNAFWFSLPYHSIYRKASDIAAELGPANINVVGKWEPDKQQLVLYYYFHGHWRGKDFSIDAGDGLMIGVVRAFDWAVNGTDMMTSIDFGYHPMHRSNLYWIGLPYTGTLGTASQLALSIEGGLGPGYNTKIVRIGKWDYSRQMSSVFAYGSGGWGGDNFTIGPGDGIWIEIVSSFVWSPPLLTPEVP